MRSTVNVNYISVGDALKMINEHSRPLQKKEKIPVSASINRILSDDIPARRDIPAFDNSAMDGFLFLTDDLEKEIRTFKIHGEIRPEHTQAKSPEPKTCTRIMTGAPLPEGRYTVVPVELTEERGGAVTVVEIPERNPVRKQGEGYEKGKTVLSKNTVIRPYEMGLMIESGNRECSVKKKIRIAIQVTGSEIDEDMNSNGPVLDGLISRWPGTEVKQWPVLADDPELVLQRMYELGKSADIVLTTGGISMGRHDYISGAMKELGAEVIFRKVQQKPGKPLTVTRLDDTLYFHLPGNPVSAIFSAEFYVRRAVYSMLGLEFQTLKAITATGLENLRGEKTLFVTGKMKPDEQNRLAVTSDGVMKSHLLQLYRDHNVYIQLEPESSYSPGDLVDVIPFSTGLFL
ncbi:MAG: molybdopterin molybdotransferase MoeA [Balneolaceae bacterium]